MLATYCGRWRADKERAPRVPCAGHTLANKLYDEGAHNLDDLREMLKDRQDVTRYLKYHADLQEKCALASSLPPRGHSAFAVPSRACH